MMRLISRLAMGLVIAHVLVAPSFACMLGSASVSSVANEIEQSAHVFRGTVVEINDDKPNRIRHVRFEIEQVYVGRPIQEMVFRALPWSGSCGWFAMRVGDRDVFFVRWHEDELWALNLYGLAGNEQMVGQALELLKHKGSSRR